MTKEKFWDLMRRADGATNLLVPTTGFAITPDAGNDYAFGVARWLQCNGAGALTVVTLAGDTLTVTLVAGGKLEIPTVRCTAFAGTGLFAAV